MVHTQLGSLSKIHRLGLFVIAIVVEISVFWGLFHFDMVILIEEKPSGPAKHIKWS